MLWASHLAQQTLQLPLEVAVLALERLVLGQGQLQTSLQRKQVLLLLPAGEGRRLAVLDHALLPLGDLGLVDETHTRTHRFPVKFYIWVFWKGLASFHTFCISWMMGHRHCRWDHSINLIQPFDRNSSTLRPFLSLFQSKSNYLLLIIIHFATPNIASVL